VRKLLLALCVLSCVSCGDGRLPDIDDEIVVAEEDIGERSQAILGPWYPGANFRHTWNDPAYNYWASTGRDAAAQLFALTQPNQPYQIRGTVRNAGGSTALVGNVDWFLHFYGVWQTGQNMCVIQGCTFWVCARSQLNRFAEKCRQTWGQGTTSGNPDLYGTVNMAVPHVAGDTIHWSMIVFTSQWWPYPGYIDEFSITAHY